ncbi:MAG: response regulator, partial [Gluconacetobacter diazotrophicus]|nr:response regulator [Gluconacetobacter diazotrophicus]
DHQRLRQVLLNFLSNAVKYNREGGRVRLECRELPLPARPDGGRVRIEVSDTGPGLTAEEIGKLFTPFERLQAERGTTEGTGLGLALSKSLVEAMDGHIGVDSVPGEGSVFWIELPLADHPAAHQAGDRLALPGGGSLVAGSAGTILYIEDNLSNLRLIESLFGRDKNLTLLSAEQGTLGIEIARARVPDLILLDLHLPDVPGWEVLAQLRADALTSGIPVIVISADATPHRIERLREAGAQDYLAKPINVRELLRILRERLPAAPAAAAGAGI